MLPAVGDESGSGQRRVPAHDHELDRLSGPGVWHPDRASLENARMAHRHILDFVRIDVEAGDIDHVLLAIDHVHIAALVDARDVARPQETVSSHHFFGLVWPVPVARHDLRAFDAKLAGFAELEVAAL